MSATACTQLLDPIVDAGPWLDVTTLDGWTATYQICAAAVTAGMPVTAGERQLIRYLEPKHCTDEMRRILAATARRATNYLNNITSLGYRVGYRTNGGRREFGMWEEDSR